MVILSTRVVDMVKAALSQHGVGVVVVTVILVVVTVAVSEARECFLPCLKGKMCPGSPAGRRAAVIVVWPW